MIAAPKFTPIPWVVRPCRDPSKDGGYAEIGSENLNGEGDYVALVYDKRDANVLSAAPELYEACRSICGVFEGHEDVPIYVQKARAALTKAAP